MKTRKTLFASLILLFLALVPLSAMGQSMPHTFTANTAAKASEVNANFTYLLERIETRKTTINCPTDSITNALKDYNHILISGVCSENLLLKAALIPHRFIILEGVTGSSTDGITAADSSSDVIAAQMGIKIKVKNLTLSGGTSGIKILGGGIAVLESSKIENMSDHGAYSAGAVSICNNSTIENIEKYGTFVLDSSFGIIEKCQLTGNSSSDTVRFITGSGGQILDSTITGGKSALLIERASSALIGKSKAVTITGAETGITVHGSSNVEIINTTINSNSGDGINANRNSSVYLGGDNTITNNGGYAVRLARGSTLSNKCSKTNNISSNSKGVFYAMWGSEASLCNMTLSSNGVIIQAQTNSTVFLTDSSITSSSERVIDSKGGVALEIDNTSITGNSSQEAVQLNDGSNLHISGSTVSGGKAGISAVYNSTVRLHGGNTITGNAQHGIHLLNSTLHQYSDVSTTTISSNTGSEIRAERSFLKLEGVTITGTGGNTEVDLRYGSLLMLGSGSSVTGTVNCGNTPPDNGTFVNNSGTTVTTSGC